MHQRPRQNTTLNGPPDGYEALFTVPHRFTFNGQERTDEIAGTGNHTTALFWEYDTRLGRRWNLDPKPNPQISYYACNSNSPIIYKDILGDTIVIFMGNKEKDPVLYLASQQLIKRQVNDGVFIIVGHASPLVMQKDHSKEPGDYEYYSAENLIPLLRSKSQAFDKCYSAANVRSLILLGCNTANDPSVYYDYPENVKGKRSLAEELSKDPNIKEVVGTTGYVVFGKKENGSFGVLKITSVYDPHQLAKYKPNDEGLVKYKEGKKVTLNEKGESVNTYQPNSYRNCK